MPIIYAQYWYLKVRYWYWYWYLFVEYLIQDWEEHCKLPQRAENGLVRSRDVRKPPVAIILSILKCMFNYSRSISSAGVLTPPHNLVYGTELYEAKKH